MYQTCKEKPLELLETSRWFDSILFCSWWARYFKTLPLLNILQFDRPRRWLTGCVIKVFDEHHLVILALLTQVTILIRLNLVQDRGCSVDIIMEVLIVNIVCVCSFDIQLLIIKLITPYVHLREAAI